MKEHLGGLTNIIVERKDYERLPEMSQAAIYAVMTRIMLRRLVA